MTSTPAVRIRPSSETALKFDTLPPLSLYVHVPWCVRKCLYCDFNSHKAPDELPEQLYLEALRADLEQALPLIWGRQVVSVFIGGGTPSLLSAKTIDDMLAMIRAYLRLLPDAEITLEANPGTVEAERFAEFGRSGVNRISLGVQSFDDSALKALGRVHSADQARRAIEIAQRSVPRINIDLMYALPEQTLALAAYDLQQALSFDPEHLSLYHLSLEPNTVFAKYPPEHLPDEDTSALIQDHLIATAQEHGIMQYEISAYAKAGKHSRHNMNYWEFGDYLGIGPGAHGKLSFPDRVIRQSALRSPESWMQAALKRDGSHLAEEYAIAFADFPFEFMLNALRLKQGVPASYYEERTGQSLRHVLPTIKRCLEKGLLADDPVRIKASDLGWRFLNDLQAEFLKLK
ncbi:radical SAM family heme chaperone HemW [Paenalcaligenes niemegkensis]|uniref:radical SAM family heme chaperone HemW n=1 Tax=Paenalcaligenes niemegkensis TaxID=2895469 RepID=UPI001EE8C938|nr:radical SAM family heme chaperone HemW [Paenalcaligenes niemegkensis]MCQ9616346.1 radical SAM family heme chaperone HemW [Paenalcaligenes niemegkensis]